MSSRTASQQTPDRSARKKRRTVWFPYLLLIPSAALIALVNLYPFAVGFLYSLEDGTLIQEGSFVGLQNYLDVWSKADFIGAIWFTAIFAFFGVFGSWAVGMGLAMLLNQEMPARGFMRVAFIVPWILPSVVVAVSWRWIINDQNGLLNMVLGWAGLDPVYLLSTGPFARFSVTLVKVWRSFPFMMISLLAALQTISHDLYEAASIDGAGRWQSFRFVTLPHLLPVSVVLWILMTIWSVNDFDTPWLLTGGGPSNATENLSVIAFKYTFQRNDVGVGAAMAFVTLVILMIFSVLLLRAQGDED